MGTLIIRTNAGEDTQPIVWQQGYEFCLEDEDWTETECTATYTIPDDDTPAWLEHELDANPDVLKYWMA